MPNAHFKSQIYVQNLIFLTLQQFYLPNGLPAVRPGSTMASAPVFSRNKGRDLRKCYSEERLPNAP